METEKTTPEKLAEEAINTGKAIQDELPGVTPEAEALKTEMAKLKKELEKKAEKLKKHEEAEAEAKKALLQKAADEKNFAELIKLKDEESSQLQAELGNLKTISAEAEAYKSYVTATTEEAWKALSKEDKAEVEKIPGFSNDDPIKKLQAIKFYNEMKAKLTPDKKPNPFGQGSLQATKDAKDALFKSGDKKTFQELAAKSIFESLQKSKN